MLYFWWSCRGNLKLITFGSEKVITATFHIPSGQPPIQILSRRPPNPVTSLIRPHFHISMRAVVSAFFLLSQCSTVLVGNIDYNVDDVLSVCQVRLTIHGFTDSELFTNCSCIISPTETKTTTKTTSDGEPAWFSDSRQFTTAQHRHLLQNSSR